MTAAHFIFTIHCHQPVGNFDHVIEDAYRKSYHPLLEALESDGQFTMNLHISGYLLDWIANNHPEYVDRLAALVEMGRVEMITGGFYEPILPVIPHHDRVGQIVKLSDRIRHLFGCEPAVMWLAERVWEPHLPVSIHDAGVKGVFIDDTHVKLAGLPAHEINGFYAANSEGSLVNLFPGNKQLRYSIPFQQPSESIKILRSACESHDTAIIVFADDCEKFGVWPGTYDWVYKQNWLKNFFRQIHENSWIRLSTVSSVLSKFQPSQLCNPPDASYEEMMEWALPTDTGIALQEFRTRIESSKDFYSGARFVRGGFWRNFPAKYEESNHLLHKVIRLSLRFAEYLAKTGEQSPYLNDDPLLSEIQNNIWKAQCNDAYWHGVFGGLYAPHLRFALYQAIIEAEKLFAHLEHKPQSGEYVTINTHDFNCDGLDEIVLENDYTKLYVHPHLGGSISEWDVKSKNYNIVNTLKRRQEPYHLLADHNVSDNMDENENGTPSIHDLQNSISEEYRQILRFDTDLKYVLMDRLFPHSVSFEDYKYGSDKSETSCPGPAMKYETYVDKGNAHIVLKGIAVFHGVEISIEKNLMLDQKGTLHVRYNLRNQGNNALNLCFGVEMTFNMLAGHAHDRYYEINDRKIRNAFLDAEGINRDVSSISLVDRWGQVKICITFPDNVTIWRVPVFTISKSESGFEKVFQGSSMMPCWRCTIPPGEIIGKSFMINAREFLP